jgi:hypothetical protein
MCADHDCQYLDGVTSAHEFCVLYVDELSLHFALGSNCMSPHVVPMDFLVLLFSECIPSLLEEVNDTCLPQ